MIKHEIVKYLGDVVLSGRSQRIVLVRHTIKDGVLIFSVQSDDTVLHKDGSWRVPKKGILLDQWQWCDEEEATVAGRAAGCRLNRTIL